MSTSTNDHRPRVAAERRQRTRMRLLESAMVAFAHNGIGASVIPDVVAAAKVSQGTFYNYFRTNEELLQALAVELNRDIVSTIEAAVSGIRGDPALKLATAIRSYLHLMWSHPVVAQFMAHTGLRLAGKDGAFYDYLARDLRAAQNRGQLDRGPVQPPMDIVAGAGLMALYRMTEGKAPGSYLERVIALILRALGANAGEIARLAAFPLPRLHVPPGSLLAHAAPDSTDAGGTAASPRRL
jgi:AcrR family transcriptional regulator